MDVTRTIFIAELLERFAYYGAVFVVPSFATVVLGASQQLANVLLNIIFAVSPLTSIIACFPADSPSFGKAKVLVIGAVMYTLGLALFTVSSAPFVYDEFPGKPKNEAWVAFTAGVILLSLGYGFYKAVTAPIVADAFEYADVPESKRTAYFAAYAWVINVGALGGTLASPFLRRISAQRTQDPTDPTSEVTVAYYYSFGACTIAAMAGLIFVVVRYKSLRAVEPSTQVRDVSLGMLDTIKLFFSSSGADERQCFFRSCATFIPLPCFWLVQNQFLSNVMFQVQWTDMPSALPQEFFNNINTIVGLITIVLLQLVFRRRKRIPAQRTRMLVGIGAVSAAMIYCAGAQMAIDERGYFDVDGNYYLRPGRVSVSAWVFVPVYAISGVSSALIDPTTLEAAFALAPPRFKSVVMCVYLVSASMSGWLGLAFAPLATPGTLTLMYSVMAVLLSVVALLWRRIRISGLDTDIVVAEGH